MKVMRGNKICAIAIGVILLLFTFTIAKSEEIGESTTSARIPPIVQDQYICDSSAPGYCASNGGSHDFEYILDATYTHPTDDTIAITVEIYIANPTNCQSGQPCPEYDNSPEYINAWIDWDGDKVFESGEKVLDVALTGYLGINYYGTMSTSTIVSVPADAVDVTWMRVNLGWSDEDPPVDPCDDPCELGWTWGDIRDYLVSTQIAIPRIDEIIVEGIPDTNNPVTSDTSVAGVEKVRLEAVIVPAAGYTVTNVGWSGDVPAGTGNPYEYVADPGSHGMKYVMCSITFQEDSTGDTWTDTRGRNFGLLFIKAGNDDGDSEPNWFEYWKSDQAVPDINLFTYNSTATYYGCYGCSGGTLQLGPSAAGQHYSSAIVLTTHFGTESFGGPTVKGIDCAAEVIAHELYHKWVDDQWDSGGQFHGETDSDEGSCTGCDDDLPDDYETNTSHTSNSSTDTYDLEHKKASDYKYYGDQEYMAMRAGDGSRGTAIRDWANPGKQSNPPYACHSMGDYALAEAMFTGQFFDLGVDTDEDLLYNHLRVSAEIKVIKMGFFHIFAQVKDPFSNEVTWRNMQFALEEGIHNLVFDFDGLDIREHGVDGPYTITFDVNNGEFIDIADAVYTTSPYTSEEFQNKHAVFTGTYSDYGVDTDGDGQFDNLTIEVGVNVATAGNFTVEGGLYDPSKKAIQMVSSYMYLAEGMQTVNLVFDGLKIFRNRANGPFSLRYLSISGSPQDDFIKDAYTTAPYSFSDFEKPDAILSGTFSDHGSDTDSDGAFNYLTVNVGINATLPGDYTLVGLLYDENGNQIVDASTSSVLAAGTQTMQLNFEGVSIYIHGVNGPYKVKYLTIYDDNGPIDTIVNAYTTGAYSYNQFQLPLAYPTGNCMDSGVDSDSDGKFDVLAVNMEVALTEPGYFVAQVKLKDKHENTIGDFQEYIGQLSADTPTMIPFNFDGKAIYDNGVDGPYYLSDFYIYHAGDPFQPVFRIEGCTTNAYSYCDFGNCPPDAHAGHNQLLEQAYFQGADVTLDGSESSDDGFIAPLTYTWTWDGGTATGVSSTISLPLGTTTVTLKVDDGEFTDTDTVDITIEDTTPPTVIACEDVTVEQATYEGTEVTLSAAVSDICDPDPDIEWSHGPTAVFPLGDTIVTVTATDASGNSASDTVTVHVVDTTPPELFCIQGPNPYGIKPGKPVPADNENPDCFYKLQAVDICDPDPDIFVGTASNNYLFGPLKTDDVIKINVDPDADPEMKSIGSPNGLADKVIYHIILTEYPVLLTRDFTGNIHISTDCIVVPPYPM